MSLDFDLLEPPSERDLLRYVRYPARFTCAEGARLLVDGKGAFPEMLAAIESAHVAIDMETYILRADATGRRFADALCAAARRGVRVRLMYDWVGCLWLPGKFVRSLTDSGVDVRVYHPLVLARPAWAMNRRTHRKFLVVDERITFTGGLNIGDEYAAPEDGGQGWRDTHVRLDGHEVARRVTALFEYGWQRAEPFSTRRTRRERLHLGLRRRLRAMFRRRRRAAAGEPLCGRDMVAVKILGNEEFRYRRRIHRAYVQAINSARRYVLIENAYFIPNGPVRRALARAVARGVKVAVVVARKSDVRITTYATRHLYHALLGSGVRIFEWPDGMMHAKTAVIDDAWSIVGSYNFDHRSLLHQLEAVAVVLGSEFAQSLRRQTEADIARCEEVTLARHNARDWWCKVLETLAYAVRAWL